jgi:uncharacterized protein
MKALLNTIVQIISKELSPDKIYLFGSHAWGNPTENSDIDLMILFSEQNIKKMDIALKIRKLLRGIPYPFDLLVFTTDEIKQYQNVKSSLQYQITNRGKILYERNKSSVSQTMAT